MTVTWENVPDGTVKVSQDGLHYVTPSLSTSKAAQMNGVTTKWGSALRDAISAVGPHVPYEEAMAILFSESGGDPTAVSPAGAIGLMQLMPKTAGKSASDLKNVSINLRSGVQYLENLQGVGNDLPAIASMYNAGFNPVNQRPWTNAESSPSVQTDYGYRAEHGYIDAVIAANNYLVTGQAATGDQVIASTPPKTAGKRSIGGFVYLVGAAFLAHRYLIKG